MKISSEIFCWHSSLVLGTVSLHELKKTHLHPGLDCITSNISRRPAQSKFSSTLSISMFPSAFEYIHADLLITHETLYFKRVMIFLNQSTVHQKVPFFKPET